jgi:two-component sensor histidine kinase
MRRPMLQPVVCSRSFPARLDQVREVRRYLGEVLAGCPAADDLVLSASELAGNSVLHSASGRPGGTFIVRVEVRPGIDVLIEVADGGGPWVQQAEPADRPHGLDLVRVLAAESGVRGDPMNGRVSWARFTWDGSAADRLTVMPEPRSTLRGALCRHARIARVVLL